VLDHLVELITVQLPVVVQVVLLDDLLTLGLGYLAGAERFQQLVEFVEVDEIIMV